MSLTLRTHVAVPRYDREGEAFNHGDVERDSGDVFVTNPARGAVEVIAARDGDRGGPHHARSITGLPGAGGLLCSQGAAAGSGRLVFVTIRDPGRIRVLDAATGATVRDIDVGPAPNGLAFDPRDGRLLVADIKDHSIRLISPRDGATVWTNAAIPGRPRWAVLDQSRDRYLVNIREPTVVVALDARTGAVTATWAIASKGPHGIDIDDQGGRLFVSCDGGTVSVLDLATGTQTASVAIAGGADVTWYNPALERLYVSIPDPGVVDVVDCRKMRIAERITAEPGTRGSAFDPPRQRLYVFLAKSGRIAVYDEGR